MTTDPKSYEAQRKHVLVINSPKFPGGVMRGYVAEIDYRTLERELSRCREELEEAGKEILRLNEFAATQFQEFQESHLASHAEHEGGEAPKVCPSCGQALAYTFQPDTRGPQQGGPALSAASGLEKKNEAK